jgi:UDP-N-acetylglucosamine 2-epimerase (non-hydrolysing)
MVDVICGARPNFMKVDPIIRSMDGSVRLRLVHTGQHYDHAMSQSFFDELDLPRPDINLGVGSASITAQTARIMEAYEKVFLAETPEAVIVVGDVNSTLACALVAVRSAVPVIHVEAGLRSFDRSMPEEINRVLTDQIADLLLITSREAVDNLLAEGRSGEDIVMVGNPMIDTLLRLLPAAMRDPRPVPGRPFALVTLHRPSNVDDPRRLKSILRALGRLEGMDVLFPAHPRTMRNLSEWGIADAVSKKVSMMDPMTYLEFVRHENLAAVVITDSGGVQEETSVLGVPCVTVRTSTERPVTIELGTNILCPDPDLIPEAVARQVSARPAVPPDIPFWDGRAGARIAEAVTGLIGGRAL